MVARETRLAPVSNDFLPHYGGKVFVSEEKIFFSLFVYDGIKFFQIAEKNARVYLSESELVIRSVGEFNTSKLTTPHRKIPIIANTILKPHIFARKIAKIAKRINVQK